MEKIVLTAEQKSQFELNFQQLLEKFGSVFPQDGLPPEYCAIAKDLLSDGGILTKLLKVNDPEHLMLQIEQMPVLDSVQQGARFAKELGTDLEQILCLSYMLWEIASDKQHEQAEQQFRQFTDKEFLSNFLPISLPDQQIEDILAQMQRALTCWKMFCDKVRPIREHSDELQKCLSDKKISLLEDKAHGIPEESCLTHLSEHYVKVEVTPDWQIKIGSFDLPLSPILRATYMLYLHHPKGLTAKNFREYEVEWKLYCKQILIAEAHRKNQAPSLEDVNNSWNSLAGEDNTIHVYLKRIKNVIEESMGVNSVYYVPMGKTEKKVQAAVDNRVVWNAQDDKLLSL